MARRERLHVAGGTYYVIQRGSTHQPIFSQAEDYALFERMLADSLRRTNAQVHAFCWMPQTIHLILQIDETPVARIMQSLASRYARAIHQRTGKSGDFFPWRYKAALIDPQTYMLKLLHYLHHLPVLGGLAKSVGAAANTSHAAYSGQSASRWLTTKTALHLLKRCEDVADYNAYMQRHLAPQDVIKFERAGSKELLVLGDPEFIAKLPRDVRKPRSKTSLDQIIHTVTCRMGVDRDLVLSKSRQREFSLVRALIAWHAIERGVATLSEVARYCRRDPSSLSMGIRRNRARRPELFDLTAMPDIAPLVPIGLPRTHYWNWQRNTDSSRDDKWSNADLSDAAPGD